MCQESQADSGIRYPCCDEEHPLRKSERTDAPKKLVIRCAQEETGIKHEKWPRELILKTLVLSIIAILFEFWVINPFV